MSIFLILHECGNPVWPGVRAFTLHLLNSCALGNAVAQSDEKNEKAGEERMALPHLLDKGKVSLVVSQPA